MRRKGERKCWTSENYLTMLTPTSTPTLDWTCWHDPLTQYMLVRSWTYCSPSTLIGLGCSTPGLLSPLFFSLSRWYTLHFKSYLFLLKAQYIEVKGLVSTDVLFLGLYRQLSMGNDEKLFLESSVFPLPVSLHWPINYGESKNIRHWIYQEQQ